jgi:NDP-sugar pyrophosphorylase family protein
MIEIGGKSALWHVPEDLSLHGVREFIIPGGYKEYVVGILTSTFPADERRELRHVEERGGRIARALARDPGRNRVDTMTGGRPKRVRYPA